ncbi:MAG: hypothetical protein ACOYVK_15975 [Bacillota bacterium]
MVLRLILLMMLCIPVACIQYSLFIDAAQDIKRKKKVAAQPLAPAYEDTYFERNYLKIAK